MGDDHTSLVCCAFENIDIGPANQPFLPGRPQITTACAESVDDVRSDVLVWKQGKVERLHAVILSSQVCSPLSTSAAYRNAAARLSSAIWGLRVVNMPLGSSLLALAERPAWKHVATDVWSVA
jgi:hypothetical protein